MTDRRIPHAALEAAAQTVLAVAAILAWALALVRVL